VSPKLFRPPTVPGLLFTSFNAFFVLLRSLLFIVMRVEEARGDVKMAASLRSDGRQR